MANRIGRPVDNRGYTIIPYLNPFTEKTGWISIRKELAIKLRSLSSSTVVVPDSGAAVKVKFATRTGYPWFANVTLSDGNTPPLGAEVFDSKEIAIGAVGQGGLLYARVPDIKGFYMWSGATIVFSVASLRIPLINRPAETFANR